MFPNFVFRFYNTMVLGWLLNSITLTQAFSLWANINGTGYDLSIVLCLFGVWKKDKSTTHSTLTMVIFSAFLVHTSTSVSSTFPSKEGLLYTHTPLTGFSHSLIFNFVVCLVKSLFFKRKKKTLSRKIL